MGNSKARISERITKPNKKPRRKDGPQHQHLLSFQHEEPFDDSFFSNRWNNDWMVSSRNLDNQFKEFRSLFNKEEAMVEEDNTRMEVRIDASEHKPEELKVSVQSGRLLVEGRHEEKKEDGSGYIQRSFSRRYTLPRRRKLTRWFPISPLRESLSSPHPRVPLLLQMRPMKQSEVLSFI